MKLQNKQQSQLMKNKTYISILLYGMHYENSNIDIIHIIIGILYI